MEVIEVIEAARIERDYWGWPGAHSQNHEIAQSLSAAAPLAPLVESLNARDSKTAKPEHHEADSRRCLDMRLSPLVLSQSQLACR
jgi:hypothetical protein